MTRPDLTRVIVLPLLLVAGLLAVTGCDDDATSTTSASAGADQRGGGQATPDALPGLYLTDDVAVSHPTDRQVRLVSGLPCDQLRDMVAAGQWRLADRLAGRDAGILSLTGHPLGDLLERGDAVAFAAYTGEKTCTASIGTAAKGPVTLTGAAGLPGATRGWVATTQCIRDDEKNVSVNLYFDTDAHVGGMVAMELTRAGTGYTVRADESDALQATLFKHPGGFLAFLSKALTLPSDAAPPPGVVGYEASPGEKFTGKVSLDPGSAEGLPTGSVAMSGLGSEENDYKIGITLGFACTSVAG